MRCPIDGTPLHIAERSGVEIDYCPRCRGVWLDRGELDKIIERAGARTPPAPPRPMPGGYASGGKPYKQKKKKRGAFDLLEDIFDF